MNRAISIGVVVLLAACGESPAPSGPDASGNGNDSGAAVDAPMAGPPLHDCEEADFVDRMAGRDDSRMIMVPTGTTEFDPPCMTIRAGQSVMFMWDFATHPLGVGVAPGHLGTSTTPTPIEPQTSGMLYTVAFPAAGDHAYYCTNHFHSGMYGVIRVVP